MNFEYTEVNFIGIGSGTYGIFTREQFRTSGYFGKILGTNLDSEIYFNVLLHLGTLIAIIIVFHEDIWHMIQEFFRCFLLSLLIL